MWISVVKSWPDADVMVVVKSWPDAGVMVEVKSWPDVGAMVLVGREQAWSAGPELGSRMYSWLPPCTSRFTDWSVTV